VDDLFALRSVGDPQISPDGEWVAYTVRTLDLKEDNADTDIYMVPFAAAGGAQLRPLRMTASPKAENHPRFSPDGRYLAFLSARGGKHGQVWLLDRRGGEAVKLTDFQADVSNLVWSPDGKKLALVVGDVDPDEPAGEGDAKEEKKTPKPVVVRRLQFKRDGEGYLNDRHPHLYLFDLASKTSVQVTSGPYDDGDPAWSPDGSTLVFASNRTAEPDANDNTDIFVVEAKEKGAVRAVTTAPTTDTTPSFSPDGRWIVFVEGGDPKDIWYASNHVAVVPAAGGTPRALTAALDRNVESPRFAPDGKSILFLLEDGGDQSLVRVSFAEGGTGGAGPVERLVGGERDVREYQIGPGGEIAPNGRIVVLETTPAYPAEVSAVEGGGLRRLTRVNDEVLQGIRLATVERHRAKSPDGTPIDFFLTLPPDRPAGARVPTLLRPHGGPTSQYSASWSFEFQLFAANGYAVVAPNPRGSTGYGRDFSRAIWADWGNKDYQDVMAAVDEAIALGVADPVRLGVGGWSYGGILTDYVITHTQRFKAATSGASEANYLANYGTDHYQREWEAELGLPWRNTAGWLKISPWFKVDKVTTPTLLLGGEADANVPVLNSEQLYQALRRLGRDTELIVYPGQNHGIAKPSYQKDRFERYLAWYGKYLKGEKQPEGPVVTVAPATKGKR
jgi:dipeptidyl aminopeptidase/acylaminoacyl peptidase